MIDVTARLAEIHGCWVWRRTRRGANLGFGVETASRSLTTTSMPLPRAILADDHMIIAEAFCKLLEGHVDVVATVSDGRALLESALPLKPDVIIADIGMPLMNGLEAGLRLKKLMPTVKLIFLTMHEDPDLAGEAMRCGASAYLLKSSAGSELIDAVHEALEGKRYVTPRMAAAMQKSFINNPQPNAHARKLTLRQREVVQLLAEGNSAKQAASVLGITERTVGFHKYRVMAFLGLKTSAELIQFAIKSRILVR